MTNRQTGILGLATLVAVLAALWVVFSERGGGPETPDGGPLLADFGAKAASVDTVTIAKQDAIVTLQKTEGGWGIAERGGLPPFLASAETQHAVEPREELFHALASWVGDGIDPTIWRSRPRT